MDTMTGLSGAQSPSIPGGARVAELIGTLPLFRDRGRAVCDRLELFVAPPLEESPDLGDLDWVRFHSNKVRGSLKGSANLTKRLSEEPDDEPEQPRPPERKIKGEAFMAKMIELRMRGNASN